MHVQPLNLLQKPLSAIQAIRSRMDEEGGNSLSKEHQHQSVTESSVDQGAMMMMQQTSTFQYTSLRIQLADGARLAASEEEGDRETYRSELLAGIEDLIQDNEVPLQDLLNSPLLSDNQIVAVEYFSMTIVQTKTMVAEKAFLPSMDELVEGLRGRFQQLVDYFFPPEGTPGSESPDIGNPDPEIENPNPDVVNPKPEVENPAPEGETPVVVVLPTDGTNEQSSASDPGEPSIVVSSEDAPAPQAAGEPLQTPAVAAASPEQVNPEEAAVTAQGDSKPASLFQMVQRFSVVFHSSLTTFQQRMQPFQMKRTIAAENTPKLRDFSRYKTLDEMSKSHPSDPSESESSPSPIPEPQEPVEV